MIKKFNHKLNECKVRMIRIFWRDYPEVSINMLAGRFKVNVETIRLLVHGKTWKGLPIHKPHPARALNTRGYGDTNEKRSKFYKRNDEYAKKHGMTVHDCSKSKKSDRNYDQDKYPRGSVLAGGNKK